MAGRKGEKFWADAVKRAVNRRLESEEGKPKKLERLADRLVDAALDGDIQAMKEIGDRLDGKATQQTDANVNLAGSLELVKRIAKD